MIVELIMGAVGPSKYRLWMVIAVVSLEPYTIQCFQPGFLIGIVDRPYGWCAGYVCIFTRISHITPDT